MIENNKIHFFPFWKLLFIIFFTPHRFTNIGGEQKLWRRQRIYVLILSNLLSSATYFRCIRSNGDLVNPQLLILHWIPISTPPPMECNSAVRVIILCLIFLQRNDYTKNNKTNKGLTSMCEKQRLFMLPVSDM